MRTARLLLPILALVLAQCGKQHGGTKPSEDLADRLYAGAPNLVTAQTAPAVSACLLSGPIEPEGETMHRSNPLECTEGGKVLLSPSQMGRLKTILTDPKSRLLGDAMSSCIPDYGVRFTFLNGGDSISINLCFHCGQIAAYRNSTSLGGGNFNDSDGKLVAILKELFPNDPEIAKLK